MISHEMQLQGGHVLFEAGAPADALYFLMQGSLPYSVSVTGEPVSDPGSGYIVGCIHPEEIVGISAPIEPYFYTATVRAAQPCRLIEINAHALRALCEVDLPLAVALLKAAGSAAMQRLHMTRVQLAAQTAGIPGKQAV